MIIYLNINTNSKRVLLKVLKLASKMHGQRIVFNKYSERSINNSIEFCKGIKPFYLGKDKLETVTTYSEEHSDFTESDCFKFNNEIINILLNNKKNLLSSFDNITIYRSASSEWFLSVIFHEKMTLINATSADLHFLVKNKIEYSIKPPEWW